MEIVDANAGLLSNFEMYDLLADPTRNNYPPYSVYLTRVASQRARETAVSYLSAKDAKEFEAEAAEALLSAHQSTSLGADPAAAAAAATSAEAAAAAAAAAPAAAPALDPRAAARVVDLSKHTPRHRDYKPLEATCWLKDRVLSYIESLTPGARQNAECVRAFTQEAQHMLQSSAIASAKADASAAGLPAPSSESLSSLSSDARLTTLELLQLVNVRPDNVAVLYRIIEECEERFKEEDAHKLIQCIQKHLPTPHTQQQQQQQQQQEAAETADPQPTELTAVAAAAAPAAASGMGDTTGAVAMEQ